MKTHCAFGCFTLCKRYLGKVRKYAWVQSRKHFKQVDCKICKKAVKNGALPLFRQGIK